MAHSCITLIIILVFPPVWLFPSHFHISKVLSDLTIQSSKNDNQRKAHLVGQATELIVLLEHVFQIG